jgi:hypothetical protein
MAACRKASCELSSSVVALRHTATHTENRKEAAMPLLIRPVAHRAQARPSRWAETRRPNLEASLRNSPDRAVVGNPLGGMPEWVNRPACKAEVTL